MAEKIQRLPGFRDFFPEDCAVRNYIFSKWRDVSAIYGFHEYDGPILEPTELYKKKSGDEILTQLFHFEDRGDRSVAMRPELTPTLARMAVAPSLITEHSLSYLPPPATALMFFLVSNTSKTVPV